MNIDMDGSNRVNDRTFRVNFSGDGASKLREKVTDKLKEYMGDYTDDTLVEYVIVLLRNGRHKKEAENELNVFLGDDTDSFVTWLWDHLSSNLHLYVQPHESFPDEAVQAKPTLEAHAGGRDGTQQFDSESGREKSTTDSRSRRHREWKGLVRDVAEPPPLRSSEIENFHLEEKIPFKSALVERSRSPQPPVQRKRNRQEDRVQLKREVISHPTIGAPRRLLQNAVRDAVGTLRSSSLRSEPTLKRLRSVVSTSTEESSLDDRPQRIRSVARIPSAMTTAIKAAAEAAEDAIKVRCSGNVFDRLGCTTDVTGMTNNVSALRAPNTEDMCEDFDQMPGLTHLDYTHRSEYIGESAQNVGLMDRDTDLAFDSASDNDGYDGVNDVGNRAMDACQTSTSGGKDSDSLMVQYSVAKNRDEILRKSRLKDQDPPTTLGNTSHKIVNISVNVNTWKPPHYQASREVTELENRKGFQESEEGKGNPGVQPMKNDNIVIAGDQNEIPAATQRESQKTQLSIHGSYSAARPSEDADSRTVFVNNVHFAATKDSLSRHFNKFGEVLKVVILTDAATGQPKGSAYVEFMRKEAAELALSLNGTSFMSRILKVVKRGSSSLQEVAPTMTWPRMARVSPFGARLPRVPFSRGMPGAFRARLPIKPGARSLQWKRDGNEITVNTQNSSAIASSNNVPTPSPRSLTYVRTELKQDGNSAPA